MTADIRAAVLAGLDREIEDCRQLQQQENGRTLNALRLLREIAEKHKMLQNADMAWCDGCGAEDECPILLSLAQVYAPDAQREKPDADEVRE